MMERKIQTLNANKLLLIVVTATGEMNNFHILLPERRANITYIRRPTFFHIKQRVFPVSLFLL